MKYFSSLPLIAVVAAFFCIEQSALATPASCRDIRLTIPDSTHKGPDRERPAIVLFHGSINCPWEFRDIAEELRSRGFHVIVPRLPGHGTRPSDLSTVSAKDMEAFARRSFREAAKISKHVYVGGSSLGALLAMRVAQTESQVAGTVLMAPPIENKKVTNTEMLLACNVAQPALDVMPSLKHLSETLRELAPHEMIQLMDKPAPNPEKAFYYPEIPSEVPCEFRKLLTRSEDSMKQFRKPTFLITSSDDEVVANYAGRKLLCGSQASIRGLNIPPGSGVGHLMAPRRQSKQYFSIIVGELAAFLGGGKTSGRDICAEAGLASIKPVDLVF